MSAVPIKPQQPRKTTSVYVINKKPGIENGKCGIQIIADCWRIHNDSRKFFDGHVFVHPDVTKEQLIVKTGIRNPYLNLLIMRLRDGTISW